MVNTIKVWYISELKQSVIDGKPLTQVCYVDLESNSHTIYIDGFINFWYSDSSKCYILNYESKQEHKERK